MSDESRAVVTFGVTQSAISEEALEKDGEENTDFNERGENAG